MKADKNESKINVSERKKSPSENDACQLMSNKEICILQIKLSHLG